MNEHSPPAPPPPRSPLTPPFEPPLHPPSHPHPRACSAPHSFEPCAAPPFHARVRKLLNKPPPNPHLHSHPHPHVTLTSVRASHLTQTPRRSTLSVFIMRAKAPQQPPHPPPPSNGSPRWYLTKTPTRHVVPPPPPFPPVNAPSLLSAMSSRTAVALWFSCPSTAHARLCERPFQQLPLSPEPCTSATSSCTAAPLLVSPPPPPPPPTPHTHTPHPSLAAVCLCAPSSSPILPPNI